MQSNSDLTLPHIVTLKDGTEALIRKAGSEDFQMLYRMFNSFSVETMFRRFLMSHTGLEARDVQEMLRLGDSNVTSLIAVVHEDGKEKAVGEARYVADSAGRIAEAGIVVADDSQNRGLGTALFSDLVAEGRRQGLKKMIAYFDVDNKAVVRVGQKAGFKLAPTGPSTDYSMIRAEIEL